MAKETASNHRHRLPLSLVFFLFLLFQLYLSYRYFVYGGGEIVLALFGPYFGIVLTAAAATGTLRSTVVKLISTLGLMVALAVGYYYQPSLDYLVFGAISVLGIVYYLWRFRKK